MKKFLLVCLLGLGMMLPTTNINAKESARNSKRIVNVNIEGDVLISTSDANSGEIVKTEISNSNGLVLITNTGNEAFISYTNISGLHGFYIARVTTKNTAFSKMYYFR